jgi:hypothetical protein
MFPFVIRRNCGGVIKQSHPSVSAARAATPASAFPTFIYKPAPGCLVGNLRFRVPPHDVYVYKF